jgi:hypothetical protein
MSLANPAPRRPFAAQPHSRRQDLTPVNIPSRDEIVQRVRSGVRRDLLILLAVMILAAAGTGAGVGLGFYAGQVLQRADGGDRTELTAWAPKHRPRARKKIAKATPTRTRAHRARGVRRASR